MVNLVGSVLPDFEFRIVCYSMQEMRVGSLGQEDLLEEEMAIHPNIIAWKIP